MKITLIVLIRVHSEPTVCEIWVVPGGDSDSNEGGNNYGLFIDDYLEKRAICVGRNLTSEQADQLAGEVASKFRSAGFEVENVTTADD